MTTPAQENAMFEDTDTPTESASSTRSNMTTKAELLSRAKVAIDAGETSLRDAAEALALAVDDFKATQREIADAVGRSASWVNRLLKWRRTGYREYSPFGPTTKVGRVSHAQQRRTVSKSRKNTAAEPTTNGAASSSAETIRSTSKDTTTTCKKSWSPSEAKGELRHALDQWWAFMDDAGKAEITEYFVKKAGVRVS
jgi:Homeodomain-like domain